MSYRTTNEQAQQIINILRREPSNRIEDMGSQIHPLIHIDVLHEVILSMTCPIVCVGELNNERWHELCLERTNEIIEQIGYQP